MHNAIAAISLTQETILQTSLFHSSFFTGPSEFCLWPGTKLQCFVCLL